MATAFASEKAPANVNAISQLADGINHAIPTHEELQSSLRWLTEQGLVQKEAKGYQLTQSGIQIIEAAKRRTNSIIVNIWDELTNELESIERNTKPNNV